jgi:hypothetical protein
MGTPVSLPWSCPGPGRGQDEIARLHREPFAIDGGIGSAALDDESQSGLRVPMLGRDLTWQDQLQPGE